MTFEASVAVGVIGEVLAERIIERELSGLASSSVATAVNILFIDPRRNWVSGVLDVRSPGPLSPRPLKQDLSVPRDEYGAGETVLFRPALQRGP